MNFKKIAFFISSGALFLSLLFPYLIIIFTSPQYPTRSPVIYIHLDGLSGDTDDWKVVGRYIGMDTEPKLPEFDLFIAGWIVAALAMIVLISAFRSDRWKKYASVILLSVGLFLGGWAQYRFYQQGHNLDPTAPMRTIVKPFTPPLIGITSVSKIKIYHLPHAGFLLFALATVLTVYTAFSKKKYSREEI